MRKGLPVSLPTALCPECKVVGQGGSAIWKGVLEPFKEGYGEAEKKSMTSMHRGWYHACFCASASPSCEGSDGE